MSRIRVLDITVARLFKVVCPFVSMNNRIDFLLGCLLIAGRISVVGPDNLLVRVFSASMAFLHVGVGLCSCRVAS